MAEQENVDTGGLENDPAPDTTKETPAVETPEVPGDPKDGETDIKLPGAPDAEAKPQGAPEEYDLKVKEGFEFPDEAKQAFVDWAKKNNVSNELAQSMLDYDLDRTGNEAKSEEAKQAELVEADNKQEALDVEANRKEFGDKYPEAYAVVKKAAGLFSKETWDILTGAKFTSNPSFFKDMYKLGMSISEDSLEKGETAEAETFNKMSDVFPQPKVQNAVDS